MIEKIAKPLAPVEGFDDLLLTKINEMVDVVNGFADSLTELKETSDSLTERLEEFMTSIGY